MKIIITEKQELFLRRRLGEIDEYVKLAMKRIKTEGYTFNDYLEEITWQVLDEYDGKIGRKTMQAIHDYVKTVYGEEIGIHYMKSERLDW
jgi:hypothetical protein